MKDDLFVRLILLLLLFAAAVPGVGQLQCLLQVPAHWTHQVRSSAVLLSHLSGELQMRRPLQPGKADGGLSQAHRRSADLTQKQFWTVLTFECELNPKPFLSERP